MRGDEIVVTRLDHDANVAPWLTIAEEHGLVIRWIGIDTDDCTLDLARPRGGPEHAHPARGGRPGLQRRRHHQPSAPHRGPGP